MMSDEQKRILIERIGRRLRELGRPRGIELAVDEADTTYQDEWLYVAVTTPAPGVRVSDYAEILSAIEKELRAEEIQNILLVPARAA